MRKVYSLLSVQLLITVLFVLPSVLSKSYATFQAENSWLFVLSLIGTIAFMIPMVCCKHLTKETPINYILLFGFTICESYSVSLVCSFYTPDSVLMAAITTCAATIGLTAYAIKTKSDFTECAHFLMGKKMDNIAFFWSMFCVTFFITLINIFFIRSEILSVLISIGIAAIYSVYLIIDTQLIMGGREKELTMDNYVLGAVILYIDIIRLFLEMLRIFGKRNN